MLLGTDVPDELCEVAEICGGTSLISSAIISCGVHHLHELKKKVKLLLFLISCTCCILSVPFSLLDTFSVEDETGFTRGNIKKISCIF